MSWNYRVVCKNNIYGVKEVYYEKGEIISWSEDFMCPYSEEGLEGLKYDFELFSKALDKPVLYEMGEILI